MDSKREPVTSTTMLRTAIDEIELTLNQMLQVNLLSFDTIEPLHKLASDIKTLFRKYSDLNNEFSDRLLASGCIAEAQGARHERITLRNDVNGTLRIISRIKVEKEADEESLIASTQFDTSEEVSADETTIINDDRNKSESNSPIQALARSVESDLQISNITTLNIPPIPNYVTSVTNSTPCITKTRNMALPRVNEEFPYSVKFADNPVAVTRASAYQQAHTPVSSLVNITNRGYELPPRSKVGSIPPILTNLGKSSHHHSTTNAVASSYSIKLPDNPIRETHTSSYQQVHTPMSHFNDNNYRSYNLPATSHSIFSSNLYAPPHSTVGSIAPILPNLNERSHQPSTADAVSYHLLRQEVLKPSGKPFSGDPHEYHCWINVMTNKMKGVHLDAWDVLTVLHTNSSGKPQKLIEQHMTIGGVNPDQTLQQVWESLFDQFGSGNKIANSLIFQVDSFPMIKDNQNVSQLRELLSLCQLILCNMGISSELHIFNLALGLRRIWDKLPYGLQNGWRELAAHYTDPSGASHPPFSKFVEFMQRKCKELGNDSYLRSQPQPRRPLHQTFRTESEKVPSNSEAIMDTSKCLIHESAEHNLIDCRIFANMIFDEKIQLVKKNRLCFRCLGNHQRSQCQSSILCSKCDKPHPTIMHRGESDSPVQQSGTFYTNSQTNYDGGNSASAFCMRLCNDPSGKSCSKILLVDVTLPSHSTKSIRCYCILDEQSSSSFVDPKIKDFFGIKVPKQEYNLQTLSGYKTQTQGYILDGLNLKGVGQKKNIRLPSVYTNEFIPNCKNEVASLSDVKAQKHISYLAKHFTEIDKSADVLILVGRDCGAAMATKCFGYKAPYAHQTPLGWALVGQACPNLSNPTVATVLRASLDESSMSAISRFPDESSACRSNVGNIFAERADDELPGLSKNDARFLSIIADGISTDSNNNIVMPLPFTKDCPQFPDNRLPVFCRTKNTLNKLKRDEHRLEQCISAMGKNINKDHVETVPPSEITPRLGKSWYIPLFPVTQAKKNKTRLVFDSSAVYHNTSLNKELLQGPDINNQLRTVLYRFRKSEIGFSADIESMFYAFRLQPQDRDFTRFFWWKHNDPSQDIVEYRAKVHIFGNTSSPALANIGLRYSANNNPLSSNLVKDFVENNFYVDDACGCADTVEEAIEILSKTKEVLAQNNIRLHKIISNSPSVLDYFPTSETSVSTATKNFEDCSSQHTLGVEWNISKDEFVVRCNVPNRPFTKRGILSTNNSMYDPLGSVSPIILTGRLLQRKLVPSKNDHPALASLEWDDPLPEKLLSMWIDWKSSLASMDSLITFPRSYIPKGFFPVQDQTLHVFSDASTEGTGYVIYIRSVNRSSDVHVAFVAANSRVPPRTLVTVPRLELCAALDAALSAQQVAADLNIDPGRVRLYTDSQIVIGYLENLTSSFSKYVTRRISLILKCYPASQWTYVNTSENPADLASRPQTYKSLTNSCWFKGPPFLWKHSHTFESPTIVQELPETQPLKTLKVVSPISDHWVDILLARSNSWIKVLKIAQKVLSFIVKLSERVARGHKKQLPFQQLVPLNFAEKVIIKHVQGSLQPIKDLKNLDPFLDSEGIIRVGGRLVNSDLPYHVKHPVLLPKGDLAKLLLEYHHILVKHQGRIITSAAVRNAGFFLQSGSNLVKKYLNECIFCRKLRSKPQEQKMSNLPNDRLQENPPFTYSGIDVFGPFLVTDGKSTRKNSSSKKTWALMCTCLVSRAVHIEPLPSLDISCCKNALRRFFCLRGTCSKIRSDCGTNFVGVKGQDDLSLPLNELKSDPLFQNIEWEFNPPKASHFGGTWERKIGSVKRILDASLLQLGPRKLSRDELHTFLAEAASIINNTPLWDVSHSPSDPFPLTPAMILFASHQPNPAPLELYSPSDILSYGPRRWRRVQSLSDQFWSRWRQHYIHQFQVKKKWLNEKRSVKVGDIVMIRDKGLKRNAWPLARVIETKVSVDGLVRSVKLTVPSRSSEKRTCILTRPITELVMLHECEI